jgi:excisionase family DNA binding protein
MTTDPTSAQVNARNFPIPDANIGSPQPATLNVSEAAFYLGVSQSTLNTWRTRGNGPRFVRLGRKILYRLAALDDFLLSNERGSKR